MNIETYYPSAEALNLRICMSIFTLDWVEYKVLHDENKPYYVVFGHIFRPYGE